MHRYFCGLYVSAEVSEDKNWFCVLFCFQGHTRGIWRFPGQGSNQSYGCQHTPLATAMPDPSRICDLYHRSRQRRILNPRRKARDQTHNLVVPSQIHFHSATMATPKNWFCIVMSQCVHGIIALFFPRT